MKGHRTMKWYFGPATKQSDDNPPYSRFVDIVMFKSTTKPRASTHGNKVAYCFGGYDSLHEALRLAHYQFPCIRRFVDLDGNAVT